MILRRLPLRTSIPLVLVVLVVSYQAALSWADYRRSIREQAQVAKDRARLLALLISAETESQLRIGNRALVHDLVSHATMDRDVRASLLLDRENRVTVGRPVDLEGRAFSATPLGALDEMLATCRASMRGSVVEYPERASVVAIYPVSAPEAVSGFFPTETLLLVIEYDLERARSAAVQAALRQATLSAAGAGTVSALLWLFLRQAVLVRFQRLLALAHRLGRGDFSARAEITGGDEVAQLGAEFDAMARRLETGQERMDRQDRWFRELIQHSSDILLVLDPRLRILFVGAAAESTLGLAPEALEGRQFSDFVHPGDHALLEELLEPASPEPERRRLLRVARPDGTTRTLELASGRATTPAGGPALIVNARDVTERQRLEDELFQSRKLQAVGRLAAGVAHDFNNLLTTIQGHAELLASELSDRSELRGMTEVIQESVERGSALTRQLLLFGRKQAMRLEPIDINQVIEDFDRLARAALGSVTLREDLGCPLAPILGDAVRFEQVLLNLLQNARDAIDAKGTILVETRNLDGHGDVTADLGRATHVRLRVQDSGRGMSSQTRERLFEPFFTTKGPGSGTGLGLSLVYGTVHAFGGSIDVESRLGRGTTFVLTWPVTSRQPAAASPPADAPAPHGAGERILVVDDEPSIRSYVQRLLEDHGYGVLTAASAREALARIGAAAASIDAIVSDVVMPGMDGFELVRALRADGVQAPVLLMTGYIEGRPALDSLGDAPVRLIDKPFSADAFLRQLHGLLDASRASR